MEAPLHHSPVAIIMPAHQPRHHDAVLRQQQATAASSPPPMPAAIIMTGGDREQCPRCASRDTKFCYYNSYNTAQPRHFCRACRRYWTLGGSLRNVPVGGSTRKRPRPYVARRGGPTSSSPAVATATAVRPFGAAAVEPLVVGPSPAARTTAQTSAGLLRSLLLGSVPLLEGRLGFDLGLGHPAFGSSGTGAGDLAQQLGFGAGPLLWPATTVLEGNHPDAETTTPWKSDAASPLPPPAADATALMWQELAAATTATTTPLLL